MAPTPRPWFASLEDGEVYSTSEHKSIAVVCRSEEFEDNANLIGAAPDLLEALVSFSANYPMGINPFLDEAYRKARVAIDRAKGAVK